MEIIVLVAAIVLLVLVNRRFATYERRLTALEAIVRGGEAPLSAALRAAVSPPPFGAVPATPAAPDVPEAADAPEPPQPDPRPGAALPPFVAARPPPRAPGLEETLGSRWAVWVGGLALGLGGIFLVRYSIEQDLLGPKLRVAFGLAFALALMATGEWLRRREQPVAIRAFGNADIPAILTAAGTSTAFATIYAAFALYELLTPGVAFFALGAVSLLTMAAAILHGPGLAALGLLAALGSPLLVESQDPSPIALVLYLAFATGSAYGVSRLRLWRWLALSAAIGALLWGCAFLVMGDAWVGGAVSHTVVQLGLALLFLALDPYRAQPAAEARIDGRLAGILLAFALLATVTSAVIDLGTGRVAYLGLVVAMLVAASFRIPAAASGLAAAAFATSGALLIWRVASEAAREPLAYVRDLPAAPVPEAIALYGTTALALNALVLAAALLRFGLGRDLRNGPAWWYAGAATLGPLASLIAAYWRVTAFAPSVPFALLAGALGLVFAGAAGWLKRQNHDGTSAALTIATGAMASAAVAALAAGLTFAFDKGILTVALALSALGTALVAERAGVPALRYAVGALGIAVAGRLAWDPSVVRGSVGETPIFNWLLWGYGVPTLAFGAAAHILARQGRDWVVRFVEGLALVFGALLVFLEIRHALHAGDPFVARSSHLEAGLVVTEMLGFTLLTTRLDIRRADILYRTASLAFGSLAIWGAALALGLSTNPYLTHEPVLGGPIFNSLAPAYLLPAAMAAAIAISSRQNRPTAFVLAASALGLLLELAYCGLEVRRLFHDERIGFTLPTSEAELWCYTAVLILNGIVLLGIGVVRDWHIARMAAAACIVVAVLKVFLIDLSALEGLARALSFVGLGLALVAIGFVYQRLVARRSGAV